MLYTNPVALLGLSCVWVFFYTAKVSVVHEKNDLFIDQLKRDSPTGRRCFWAGQFIWID